MAGASARDPDGQSDIPDPSLVTQENTLDSFNDLNFVGYPDTADIPTSGYYITTLGQEAFRVDPWAFAHAMENSQYTRSTAGTLPRP